MLDLVVSFNNLQPQVNKSIVPLKTCAKFAVFKDTAFVLTPKNGCSTIACCVESATGFLPFEEIPPYNNRWYVQELLEKIVYTQRLEDTDLKPKEIIAFYRDPIDRFVSAVNYDHSQTKSDKTVSAMFEGEPSKEEIINRFIGYAMLNNMGLDLSYCDQHFISQYYYLNYIFPAGSNIVIHHIDNLKTVLEQHGIPFKIVNETPVEHKIISREDLSERQLLELNNIYEKDFTIFKKPII